MLVAQQFLKRALDGRWRGFIVSATTDPGKVEAGLLDRFQVFWLQPPEMAEMIPWITGIAKKVGIGEIREDAAATIARLAGMNHRDMLKLVQFVESSGMGFSVAGVEKAALMLGMRG